MLTVLVIHLAGVHVHSSADNTAKHPPAGKGRPERAFDVPEAVPGTEALDHRNQHEGQQNAKDSPPIEGGHGEGVHVNIVVSSNHFLKVTLYSETN